LLLAATLLGLALFLFLGSRTVLLGGFAKLEKNDTCLNVERALNALNDDLNNLEATTRDWAVWDDTYYFIRDRNQAYIDSTLADMSFINNRVNSMLFVRPSGQLVFGRGFDLEKRQEAPLPDGIADHLSQQGPLLQAAGKGAASTGILVVSEGAMLVSAQPVLTSDGEGPVGGTLIWARYLTPQVVESLAARTQLSLSIMPFQSPDLPADFVQAASALANGDSGDSIVVHPLNEDQVAGYTLVRDAYGTPALILRVELPREIYAQGRTTLAYLVVVVVVVGVVFGVVVLALLSKVVLSRLARLNANVHRIAESNDIGSRVYSSGRDEVHQLASGINHMLDALQKSQAEREMPEQARAQAQEELKAVLDTVGEGIFTTDANGIVLMVNPEAQRIWGYSQDEMIGMHLRELVAEPYRTSHLPDFTAQPSVPSNRNIGKRLEIEGLKKGGSTFALELQVNPTPMGNRRFYSGAASDITERKRLEAHLVQSQKMDSVGRLAGGVCHDFNNLLTLILGYIQMSREQVLSTNPVANYLGEAEKAAQRAAFLTNQLLSFSRHQVVEPTVVDLNRVVFDTDKMLRQFIGKEIELVVLPGQYLPSVKADPANLHQVVMNLVINARDAMPQGGKITISTATVDGGQGTDKGWEDAEQIYVMLSVADTGIGMSDEVKAHLFEPFFTTKPMGQGTGLGLSTCYSIVRRSGGHIEVESQPGKGTNFKVYLPAVAVEEEVEEEAEHGNGDSGNETVLVAEDEPRLRAMVVEVLRQHGYAVLEASDGMEALQLIRQRQGLQMDLLFTDMVMPRMGGMELAEGFKRQFPRGKVLFSSGYTESPVIHSEVAGHASSDFIQKPFLPADLARKVREMLDRHGPTGSAMSGDKTSDASASH